MRTRRLLQTAALALLATLAGTGCVLIPELKDKIIELAVGGSTTVPFTSQGETNTLDETKTIDFAADIDLAKVLRDAGIDPSDVKDIKMAGASYRVTRPDPAPGRQIMNGNVTVQRGGGAATLIITNFNADVNRSTAFTTAPLSPDGVTLIDQILADILSALKAGQPPTNTAITVHVTGQSQPANVPTDFAWEIKLDVSIVGTVKVTVVQ